MESFMNKLVVPSIVNHLSGTKSYCDKLINDQLARKHTHLYTSRGLTTMFTRIHHWTLTKAHVSTLHTNTPSLQNQFSTIVFAWTSSGQQFPTKIFKCIFHLVSPDYVDSVSFPRFQTLNTQCHYFTKPKPQSIPIASLNLNATVRLLDRYHAPYRRDYTRNLLSPYEFHTMHAEHCRYKTFCVKSGGNFLMGLFQVRQRFTNKDMNSFRAKGFMVDSKRRG